MIDFHPKTPGDYDIDVAIKYCGICASDLHTISGGWGPTMLPLITGHEVPYLAINVKCSRGNIKADLVVVRLPALRLGSALRLRASRLAIELVSARRSAPASSANHATL